MRIILLDVDELDDPRKNAGADFDVVTPRPELDVNSLHVFRRHASEEQFS